MELQFHHILGYLTLGLTASYGGILALFLVHFYNTSSTSPSIAKFTTAEFLMQIISTILGFFSIIYLYNASVHQVKGSAVPLMISTFLLPFVLFLFKERNPKGCTKIHISYFLISFGVLMMLHHFYVTCMVAYEWFSFSVMVLIVFGYPYQCAISVDLICCIVITSIFVLVELNNLNTVEIKFGYTQTILKALVSFLCTVLVIFLISPGAMLSFVLAYREINV